MLHHLVVTACLLSVAAAQQYYYCNSTNPVTIRDREFFLVTRRSSRDGSYPPGMICDFIAEADTKFMLDIQSFRVFTAVLTITSPSGVSTLFRGSSLPAYQSNIATPSNSVRVRFDSTGDFSGSTGVTIKVTVFNSTGCPPGWTYLYGTCFGTNTRINSLNFPDAQKACNSMRSNLLEIPPSFAGSMTSFLRSLPSTLVGMTYTFVGLTDNTSYGRFVYYWLSGTRQYQTSYMSCESGGTASSCYSYERCGTFSNRYSFVYAVYMSDCFTTRPFACSAPPGGTDRFYSLPNGSGTFWANFPLIISLLSSFVFVACVLTFAFFVRSRMRARYANSGVFIVPPPPAHGCYPTAQHVGHQQGPYYPPPPPPLCSQPAPPTYSATVCDGHGYANNGYGK